MEWIGLIVFAAFMFYTSYTDKNKILERKIKRLERQLTGGSEMSKIISSLVGTECKITVDEIIFNDCKDYIRKIVEADDEWVKVSYETKKSGTVTKIFRVDYIEEIEII